MQRDKNENYISVIAKSPRELVNEGEILHHCVGRMGYDQKFAREETLIFFIRAKDEPDVPLTTVEYSPKTHKILQCHADYNATPESNVLDFVNKKWLPYANRKLRQITV